MKLHFNIWSVYNHEINNGEQCAFLSDQSGSIFSIKFDVSEN